LIPDAAVHYTTGKLISASHKVVSNKQAIPSVYVT